MDQNTSDILGQNGSRIYLWDNLKFLLMVFVVVGHFADLCIEEPSFKSIYLWIYSFHMPLFIFIAGLLHKNHNITKKIYTNLCCGFLLKVTLFIVKAALGQKPKFSVFSEQGIPWFLFAIAAFLFLSYILRKMDGRYLLAISVVLACFSGYDRSIGDFLVLSRIFVFYPYYVLGILLQKKIQAGVKVNLMWRAIAVFLLLLWVWICFHFESMYGLRRYFTGRNPFTEESYPFGCLIRLFCYLVSLLLGGALICLIPKCKIPVVSTFGTRTLQVYFWHYPVIYVMQATLDLFAWTSVRVGKATFLLTAVLLAFVLSLHVFGYPLGYLMGKKQGKL